MALVKKYLSKEASIKELKHVKVVLGNGFDLLCGIKSSYKDFFESKKEIFLFYQKDCNNKSNLYSDNYSFLYDDDNYISFNKMNGLNVWIAFFALASEQENDYLWCDIETMMMRAFNNYFKGLSWARVFRLLNNDDEILEGDFKNLYLASVFKYIYQIKENIDEDHFYNLLLEQLNLFERFFIEYIKRSHADLLYSSYGIVTKNDTFTANCKYVLSILCNLNNVVSIDTFNFDETDDNDIDDKIHHINGDLECPIFGIDSINFQANDPRFIFTKLSRRMNYEMNNQNGFGKEEFENAIIFGHSLNEHDYSYFFPLLDKLNITNFESMNKIVFAYAIYDSKKKNAIISSYRKAIFDLFINYAKYKSLNTSPERLLDFLTTQNRIIMYQLPIMDVKHDSTNNTFGTKKIF